MLKLRRCYPLVMGLIFALLFGLLLSAAAVDNKAAGDLWLEAYSLYERAEQYYNTEEYSSSSVYYQKALKKFKDLSDACPDWNSELVSYRINHCEEKEAIVKNKLVQGSMDKPSDELVKENIELQAKLADYQDTLADEQAKLKDALSRTEKNQGEFLKNSGATEKLRQVMKEKMELEKKYSLVSDGLGRGVVEDSNLIENLRNDMEQQRKQLENVLEEKQKIENERNEFKKKYSDMVIQKADIDYQLKAENEKFKNRESQYLQAAQRIGSLSEKIEHLVAEKNNLTSKLSVMTELNCQEEQNNRSSLKTSVESRGSNSAVVQLFEENNKLKKQVQDFQKEIDRLNGVKDSYFYELNKSKEIQAETGRTIASLQSRYLSVGEEIESLKKVLNESEARELEYSKKIGEMAAKLAESKEEYNLLTAKYKELENKQDNLTVVQGRNLDLEQEKKYLSEQIRNYQLQAEEARGQIASIQDAKKKLEQEQIALIDANFSGSLESESKYSQKANELKEAGKRLNDLEVSNTEKEQKLNELLNKVKLSEENYANLHRNNNKMQQELLNAKAAIDELKKTNSAQLKDASNLNDQLISNRSKSQEYEKIKGQLEASIRDSNSKLAEFKKERDEYLEKYNDLMEKCKGFSGEKDELNKKIVDYEWKFAAYETELNKTREEAKELTAKLEEADKKERHSESLISLSEEQNISLRTKINEMERAQGEQSSLVELLKKQLEAANKGGANSKLVEVLCKLATAEEKLLRQNSAATRHRDEYAKLQKALKDLQDNRGALENKYAEAKAKVESQEKLNKEQERQIGDLLGKIDNLSAALDKSKQDRDALTKQLVEHSEQVNSAKRDYELQTAKFKSMVEEGQLNGDKIVRLTADNLKLSNNLKDAEKKVKDLEQRQEEQLKRMKALSLSLEQETANNRERNLIQAQKVTADSKKKDETISNLAVQKTTLEERLVQADKNMKDMLAELNKVNLEKMSLSRNQNVRKEDSDGVSSGKQIGELTRKINVLNESLSKSESKVVSIQKEYEKLLNKNMDIEKSFQNLNKQFISVKNDLKEAKIRIKNLESINKDFQERLLEEKNKTTTLQKDKSKKAEIINGLIREIDGFKQQMKNYL